jgi:hypothetical protein
MYKLPTDARAVAFMGGHETQEEFFLGKRSL